MNTLLSARMFVVCCTFCFGNEFVSSPDYEIPSRAEGYDSAKAKIKADQREAFMRGIGSCIFSFNNDEIPSQAEDDELCEKINSGDGGTSSG